MAKRQKLTKGQSRRIKANLKKRISGTDNSASNAKEWQSDNLGPALEGTVISRFGQHADIEDQDGNVLRCNIRRAIDSLVAGDNVVWRRAKVTDGDLAGVVEAVHERRSELKRPDYYDGLKTVAANLDQIVIVSAVLPIFTPSIIDRYLVAVEDAELPPILLLNKIDLLDEKTKQEIDEVVAIYREIGYQFHYVSTKSAEGLKELQSLLNNKASIFVGQSGVGKSSLVNSLLPGAEILVNDVSDVSGLGQHTTTVSRLHHFESGGDLIDSPGIRDFGLWHIAADRVAWCFKEFRPFLGGCKFRDCKHLNDPGCLIKEAVEDGKISTIRFESFHRILESMEQNKPSYS
ncbi:small ribosomal subunit biogenesis GTPase RsgA [Flocculibacter collagenilyticus]|uniref:small ribosomal subunit biogenesis GTPase RsgA n=1 Tax=Flocculibacter collagenilyticus TaxID=2744479 RepID=UPI0018F32CF1|nr:small ribosomal subunit biogenesis GTPase RsgA [Flocculibacter collagenilyticus]